MRNFSNLCDSVKTITLRRDEKFIPVMIVDSFLFYNEFDILEKRLKLLDSVVDKFVLVEAEETFVGNPKPLFFSENKERYSQWIDKIIHVVVPKLKSDGYYEGDDKFHIEKHQRHQILKGLEGLPDNATVMISDVDEIPDPDIVKVVKPDAALHMFMFEYSFDYMFMGEHWVGTVITTAQRMRRFGPNYFRFHRWSFPVIEHAGWHCSSFGDPKHVFNKIQNYAHSGDDKHQGQTLEDFEKFIREGIHSDGKTKLVKTPKELIARVKCL
jgi:beta-1,4-mannosyl-glycoprotein beta-1,4-N-acetylglucosaminyltransferase